MANFKKHALVGLGVGFAAYCVKHSFEKVTAPEKQFDLQKAALWAGVGAVAASIPDWFEPATSPNHRGFFHSIAVFAALVWFVVLAVTGSISAGALMVVAALGYLSHLALDACTRRCLPWV